MHSGNINSHSSGNVHSIVGSTHNHQEAAASSIEDRVSEVGENVLEEGAEPTPRELSRKRIRELDDLINQESDTLRDTGIGIAGGCVTAFGTAILAAPVVAPVVVVGGVATGVGWVCKSLWDMHWAAERQKNLTTIKHAEIIFAHDYPERLGNDEARRDFIESYRDIQEINEYNVRRLRTGY